MSSFLDRYKHYDPSEGYGSADEWARLADLLADQITGNWSPRSSTGQKVIKKDPDLELLFLDELPDSVVKLKTAFRNSLFKHHPDHGGTDAATIAAMEAYKRLLRKGFNHGA